MKRKYTAILVTILALMLIVLVACDNSQGDKLGWVDALGKAGDAKSVEFEQSVKKGDLLLSSTTQKFVKGTENWTYETTQKELSEDAFAAEKYTETTTSGTVENAPVLKLEKDMIESFEEKGENEKEYTVKIFSSSTKSFLQLADADFEKVSDLKVVVTIANDKVKAVKLEYKISDTAVQQTLKYVY